MSNVSAEEMVISMWDGPVCVGNKRLGENQRIPGKGIPSYLQRDVRYADGLHGHCSPSIHTELPYPACAGDH